MARHRKLQLILNGALRLTACSVGAALVTFSHNLRCGTPSMHCASYTGIAR